MESKLAYVFICYFLPIFHYTSEAKIRPFYCITFTGQFWFRVTRKMGISPDGVLQRGLILRADPEVSDTLVPLTKSQLDFGLLPKISSLSNTHILFSRTIFTTEQLKRLKWNWQKLKAEVQAINILRYGRMTSTSPSLGVLLFYTIYFTINWSIYKLWGKSYNSLQLQSAVKTGYWIDQRPCSAWWRLMSPTTSAIYGWPNKLFEYAKLFQTKPVVSKLFDLRRYKKHYVIGGTFPDVYGSLAFLTNDDFLFFFPSETFPHGFISNKCSSLPTFPFAAESCHPFT